MQSDLEPGVTALEIINQLTPWLEEQQSSWGLGYSWEFGGEYETSIEATLTGDLAGGLGPFSGTDSVRVVGGGD